MNELFELSSLMVFILLPLLGILLFLILPQSDRITLYYISLLITMIGLIFTIDAIFRIEQSGVGLHQTLLIPWQSFSLSLYLDILSLPLVILVHIVVLACLYIDREHFNSDNKRRIIWLFCFKFLVLFSILVEDTLFSLSTFVLSTYILIILHLFYGKASKGSTGFQMMTLFLFVDLLSFIAVVFLNFNESTSAALTKDFTQFFAYVGENNSETLILGLLSISAFSRLMIMPFTDYFIRFFEETPLNVRFLYQGITLPLAFFWLIRWVVIPYQNRAHQALYYPVIVLASVTLILSFLYVISVTNLRQFKNHILVSTLMLCMISIYSNSPEMILNGYLAVISISLSSLVVTYVLELIETHFLTIQIEDLRGLKKSFPGLWKFYFLTTAAIVGFPFMGFGVFFPKLMINLISLKITSTDFVHNMSSFILPLIITFVITTYVVFFVNFLSRMITLPEYPLQKMYPIPVFKTLTVLILFVVSIVCAPLLLSYSSMQHQEIHRILKHSITVEGVQND